MKKNKVLSAISLLTFVMVFGFQNCSKVGVQDLPTANGKVVKDGAVVDDTAPPIQDGADSAEPASGLPSDTELRAYCLKEKSGISGPVIENLRGVTVVESDNLERVEDIRGVMVIRGKTANAKAKLLRNFRGVLVVCGMEIEDIDDTRGVIALVSSKAAHVNNVRGVIRLLDSEVGSVTDFRGVIKQDPILLQAQL